MSGILQKQLEICNIYEKLSLSFRNNNKKFKWNVFSNKECIQMIIY